MLFASTKHQFMVSSKSSSSWFFSLIVPLRILISYQEKVTFPTRISKLFFFTGRCFPPHSGQGHPPMSSLLNCRTLWDPAMDKYQTFGPHAFLLRYYQSTIFPFHIAYVGIFVSIEMFLPWASEMSKCFICLGLFSVRVKVPVIFWAARGREGIFPDPVSICTLGFASLEFLACLFCLIPRTLWLRTVFS